MIFIYWLLWYGAIHYIIYHIDEFSYKLLQIHGHIAQAYIFMLLILHDHLVSKYTIGGYNYDDHIEGTWMVNFFSRYVNSLHSDHENVTMGRTFDCDESR